MVPIETHRRMLQRKLLKHNNKSIKSNQIKIKMLKLRGCEVLSCCNRYQQPHQTLARLSSHNTRNIDKRIVRQVFFKKINQISYTGKPISTSLATFTIFSTPFWPLQPSLLKFVRYCLQMLKHVLLIIKPAQFHRITIPWCTTETIN